MFARENLWNTQTTAANADFTSASYNQAATVTGSMVATMTAANAPGIDWAQSQAGLATAKANWWAAVKPDYLAKTTNANALATAYQTEINARYLVQSNATIDADMTQVAAEADAEQTREVNQAEADRVCSTTTAGLTETFVKARAEATFDYACSSADAQYEYATGNYSDYYGMQQQANQQKQSDDRAANLAYAVNAAKAEGVRDVGYATANWTYQQTVGQANVACTGTTAGATETYSNAESAAFATLQIGNATLDAAFAQHGPAGSGLHYALYRSSLVV